MDGDARRQGVAGRVRDDEGKREGGREREREEAERGKRGKMVPSPGLG